MSYSSEDAGLINQTNHIVRYKLELLDQHLRTISELTGDTADVSFNIDSTTDIRRTANITMVVTDRSWLTDNFEIGWIDKLVRFSIGLQKPDGTWKWYVLGTMLLSSDTFRYDTATQELHMSLVDLLAYGTSERGSQIGTGVRYTYESNIPRLLTDTINRFFPYKEVDIDEFPDVLPYELNFGIGSYPYDILRTVLGLFPWFEQYYDSDGVYHAHQIPMHIDEPCMLGPDDLNDLIIAENKSFDFSNIKNTTEIYGKSIKAHYTASTCTIDRPNHTMTLGFLLSSMETLENNKKYGFTMPEDSPASPKIHIELTDSSAQDTADLLDSYGNPLPAAALKAGYSYVARCLDVPVEEEPENEGDPPVITMVKKFYLMGQKEIHVIVREMNRMPSQAVIAADELLNDCADIKYVVNADSPYACDRNDALGTTSEMTIAAGEIRQVLYDGDYANIYTTELAYERGAYENYLKCRMNTDVELTTILIPFIDVNKKIEYKSPITGETHQYIVKSVNMDISAFTMTMKLARFYNYYPNQ